MYFLNFIYDYSVKTWVYILKETKEKRFEQIQEILISFKNLVEKQSDCMVRYLRINRGNEYTSNEFEIEFCKDNRGFLKIIYVKISNDHTLKWVFVNIIEFYNNSPCHRHKMEF